MQGGRSVTLPRFRPLGADLGGSFFLVSSVTELFDIFNLVLTIYSYFVVVSLTFNPENL